MSFERRTRRVKGNIKTAVAYIRVSTDEQRLGPEAQRADIEAWAAREGVHVAAWFTDTGVSGKTPVDKRPALLDALAALRTHKAGVLVAQKRDRLARDTMVAGMLQREVGLLGAHVITVAEAFLDLETPEGRFMATVFDAFSELERARIALRTRAAMRAKKARGETTGTPPFGCAVDSAGRLVPAPDEQATVLRIRDLAASGVTRRGIVAALGAEGLAGRNGRPLGLTQVQRVLERALAT
jgi:DNA invertase Pin-like site-specific DNA recombinase